MATRKHRIPTANGDVPIRVTFGVAADFEDETGISIYAGDLEWMRRPKLLLRFLYLAAVEAADDPDKIDEAKLRRSIDGDSFFPIIRVLTEAITGRKPKDIDDADSEPEDEAGGQGNA